MITHYVKCWINSQTGDIEHLAVSDSPILHDPIIPQPTVATLTYLIEEFEIKMPADGNLLRAVDLLGSLENIAGKIELKADIIALGGKITKAKERRDFKNAPS